MAEQASSWHMGWCQDLKRRVASFWKGDDRIDPVRNALHGITISDIMTTRSGSLTSFLLTKGFHPGLPFLFLAHKAQMQIFAKTWDLERSFVKFRAQFLHPSHESHINPSPLKGDRHVKYGQSSFKFLRTLSFGKMIMIIFMFWLCRLHNWNWETFTSSLVLRMAFG